jgi:hypothetical protein
MASVDTQVHISWSQVDAWENQVADLQKKIEAAKVLLPPRAPVGVPSEGSGPTTYRDDASNFMGSVVEIANTVKVPINKEEMRRRLRARGFGEDKLGKRLDVTLYKTKTTNRLTFENGMISGAPPNA